ncbi:class I SAM-dependent methyltransferase [Mucilaginibacter sp. X4EP1]|jgi:ubiquinone/menaquinone biosynthesis C-methylase UbiE|uniref:class I SAM-dependent methyltransferase n=1 Tax=Mucilaginibacter sp. X4EP1 TaxID=2723092 RepID=UPI002166C829|nr:class I SAM-dependent methyltransferase [Mucilaginibacter sp. X4EP1]MCS3814085.1 ubiquinone/menaquinone biosynthesis C-methylase UbiE [Mucilaginibacter sp. X4EP1]
MINTLKNYIKRRVFAPGIQDRGVVEAYDIWADNYDAQPGNLMLDMDEALFAKLLKNIDIADKVVADIGCGTGRHWKAIFEKSPAGLTGFDVSGGMLHQLKKKYPAAETFIITDNQFAEIGDATYDVILSTLTVAHIKNIEQALSAWCRILKSKGDIIITDFHPNALASGGQRTFRHKNTHIAVENYVHGVDAIKEVMLRNGFYVFTEQEKRVDETVKHYYQEQNALHVYDKFKDCSIIYGIHFRRA